MVVSIPPSCPQSLSPDDIEVTVVATDRGAPPLDASVSIRLIVTDVNEFSPEFLQSEYESTTLSIAPIGKRE